MTINVSAAAKALPSVRAITQENTISAEHQAAALKDSQGAP